MKNVSKKAFKSGPCGLYCGACGATGCDGCQSDHVDDWVRQCKFRQCAREKKLDFCCFCRDYPCQSLHDFMNDKWPHHWTMASNLAFIQENGVDGWLRTQKRQWSCENCGTDICWYQKKCSCGQSLDAWELPA